MQLRKLRKKICKFGLHLKCGLDISLGDTYKLLNLYLVKTILKNSCASVEKEMSSVTRMSKVCPNDINYSLINLR